MSAYSHTAPRDWVAIVDDDDSIRRSLARVLRVNDIGVRTFASAEDYLARTPRDEPRCLVLDVQLGGLSGFELRDRLAAEGKTAPIIFITAVDEIALGKLNSGTGPYTCLRKPFETTVLLAHIRRHLSNGVHRDLAAADSASSAN